jgi:hypothetical protein
VRWENFEDRDGFCDQSFRLFEGLEFAGRDDDCSGPAVAKAQAIPSRPIPGDAPVIMMIFPALETEDCVGSIFVKALDVVNASGDIAIIISVWMFSLPL